LYSLQSNQPQPVEIVYINMVLLKIGVAKFSYENRKVQRTPRQVNPAISKY